MADQPSVTIVVNNYNYGRFLREAVDSALAQTYPRTTVVVVDDGSTDESRELIAAYGGRIVPLLKANGGQASAINAGIAASRGDLVLVLDADDALFPDAAARVVAAWRPGVVKVQFRLQLLDASGKPRPVFLPDRRVPMPSGDLSPIVLSRFVYPSPPTSGNAYARAALERLGPVPERAWRITADAYFATALAFQGEIVSIDAPLGYYRVHGGNNHTVARPTVARLAEDVAHALQRETLVRNLARAAGRDVAPDLALRDAWCAAVRLGLRVAAPARYPRPAEGALWLARQGLRAALRAPHAPVLRRVALATWFALLPALPRPLARRLALTALGRKRAALFVRAARPERSAAAGVWTGVPKKVIPVTWTSRDRSAA